MKMSRFTNSDCGWKVLTIAVMTVAPMLVLGQTAGKLSKGNFSQALSQQELNAFLQGKAVELSDATKIAMLANRSLGDALNQFRKAKAAVREVNSAFLPQLSLGAQAMEFDKANTIDLGALTGGTSLPLTIANRWNPSLGAGLTMQLDISGAVRAASSQSEFMAVAARIDIDRIRNQIGFDVRSAFYQVVRAHGQQQVAEENFKVAETKLRDARLNEGVGNSPKFDVVCAERDVSEAEQGVVAARSRESIALSVLKNVIGVDQSADFLVATGVELKSPSIQEVIPFDAKGSSVDGARDSVSYGPYYDGIILEAKKLRPEILESLAVIESTKYGVQYARSTMLPMLSAGLEYNYQPNNGAFTLQISTVASLSLNIPIFDGGLARARIREAEADKATAQSAYRGAVDQVRLEIQNAYVNILQAQTRIKMADAGLASANEAYRLAKERYKVGVTQSSVLSPQLELSSAQAALTLAQSNRVDAIADFKIAQAALDHAIGRFAIADSK